MQKGDKKDLQHFFCDVVFFFYLSLALILFPFFPVEVKWPCGNKKISSFPLQLINSDPKNCSAGRAMLGYCRDQSFGTCCTQFFGKEKGGADKKIPAE